MDKLIVEGYLNELTDPAKRFFCLEVNNVNFIKTTFAFRIAGSRLEVLNKSSGFMVSYVYLEDIKQIEVS